MMTDDSKITIWPETSISQFQDGGRLGGPDIGSVMGVVEEYRRRINVSYVAAAREIAEAILAEAETLDRQDTNIEINEAQKITLRERGLSPERIAMMSDDTTYEEWKLLKAAS